MSKTSRNLALCFYKYTGMLSIRFENGSFTTSKLLAFLNFFKLILCLSISLFATLLPVEEFNLFRFDIYEMPQLSKFSLLAHWISFSLLRLTPCVLLVMQVWNLEKMEIFLNECLSIKLRARCSTLFERSCVIHFKLLGGLIVSLHTTIFLGLMIPSVLGVVVFYFYMYPTFIVMGFVSFLKNFEHFIVTAMYEIKLDLGEFESLSHYSKIGKYLKISRKYEKLNKLLEKFQDAFEPQLTFVTCSCAAAIIFKVSYATRRSSGSLTTVDTDFLFGPLAEPRFEDITQPPPPPLPLHLISTPLPRSASEVLT